MAIDVGTLVMKFDADDKKLKKGFLGIENGIKKISKAAAIGAAAVGAALVGIATKSIKLAAEQEKAEARLESIAKKVTKATDQQVASLKRLAAETQKVSTFGDEVLITGQSQLLSFGLQADQVEQLTGSLADLLAANNGISASSDDAIGAANLLGKAFSGQAGALSRVGILLDDASAEVLKNGSAAEKTAELVKIMDANYGGLAETLSQTTEGQLQQAKNAIGDVGEVIGFIFLPFVNDALKVVQDNLPKIQKFFTDVFGSIGDIINSFVNTFDGSLSSILTSFREAAEGESPFFDFIAKGILVVETLVFKIEQRLPSFQEIFSTAFDKVIEIGTALWNFFRDNIIPIIEKLVNFVIESIPLVREKFELVFNKIIEIGTTLFNFFKDNILPIFINMVNFVVDNLPLFREVFVKAFDSVLKIINRVWGFIKDNLLPIFEGFYQFILDNTPLFENIIKIAMKAVGIAFETVSTVIVIVIDVIEELFEIATKVFGAIGGIVETGINIISEVINGVIDDFKTLIDFVNKAITVIKNFFSAKDKGDFSTPTGITGTRGGASNIISGQRAFGGNVTANDSFLVGERGPEIFTPSTNGKISTAPSNVTINVNGAKDANMVANEIVRILAMQGITR